PLPVFGINHNKPPDPYRAGSRSIVCSGGDAWPLTVDFGESFGDRSWTDNLNLGTDNICRSFRVCLDPSPCLAVAARPARGSIRSRNDPDWVRAPCCGPVIVADVGGVRHIRVSAFLQ